MAAPVKNINALKYTPEIASEMFISAIATIKKDESIFNMTALHKAMTLPCKRSLKYISVKYHSNPVIFELWQQIESCMYANLELHLKNCLFKAVQFV